MKKATLTLLFVTLLKTTSVIAQSPSLSWAKGMGGPSDDYSYALTVDLSGNVYSTGSFKITADFDPGAGTFNLSSFGGDDIFISKLDASGNFVWAKNIGGTLPDQGFSIAIDALGNIYTTGAFRGTADFDPNAGTFNLTAAAGADIFISKLDASGNFVWAKSIGALSDDASYAITLDTLGNIYTTGFYEGTVDFDPGVGTFNLVSGVFADAFILKLDSSGNFVWAKGLSGFAIENGRAIAVDASGNVITMGVFQNTADFDPGAATFNLVAAGVYDIYISKLDAYGNFIWAKSMGGTSYDHGSSMAVDTKDNIYTTGVFQDTSDFDPNSGTFNLIATGNSQDIFISKLDSSGNFEWAKSMGAASGDQGHGVAVDPAGSVYTTGNFNGTVDFDPGSGAFNLVSAFTDCFISKLDASGNFVWAKSIIGNSAQIGNAITIDALANIYTLGDFQDTADFDPNAGVFNLIAHPNIYYFDVFIQKLSQTGTGINQLSQSTPIQIYPNPSSGIINFICYQNLNKAKIRVYNAYSQIVFESNNINDNTYELNLINEPNGVYFMTISIDNEMYSTKIILQH